MMSSLLLDAWCCALSDDGDGAPLAGRVAGASRVSTREIPAEDDGECIHRLQAGEVGELEDIFHLWAPNLLRFAQRLGLNAHDADAVVADVFLDLWNRRETLPDTLRLRPYLYAAVRNRSANVHRTESREQRRQARAWQEEQEPLLYNSAPVQVIEATDEAAHVWEAARALPPQQRLALELRFAHELSLAEVADVMQLSVPAVKMLLQRAIRTLRVQLQGIFEQM